MTGDEPRHDHDDPSDGVGDVPADREAAADAAAGTPVVDPPSADPAPHRPHLWLAVFLIVVGLTVVATIVGFVTDDRSSWGVAVPAVAGALGR